SRRRHTRSDRDWSSDVCSSDLERWLPHRSRAIVSGRGAVVPHVDIVILNYEIVVDHRVALASRRPRALVLDESHYCKNPRAKRRSEERRVGKEWRSGVAW